MDAFKHVNNTVYFKYQEVSRFNFFRVFLKEMDSSTFDVKKFEDGSGLGPILSDTYVSFKFPVSFPDILVIGATVNSEDMYDDRYKISHAMWSLRHNRIAALGYGTVVSYNFESAKVEKMPADMVEAIRTVISRDSMHMLPQLQDIKSFEE
jgi:acyl-CoA thioester hydrolase